MTMDKYDVIGWILVTVGAGIILFALLGLLVGAPR